MGGDAVSLAPPWEQGVVPRGIQAVELGSFERDGFQFSIDKYVCFGPREDDAERKVIGVFGGIHGDERAGTMTCFQLMQDFAARPEYLSGYELHVYPGCNPHGLLFGRRSNGQVDLNRAFWQNSQEEEIRVLEEELRRQRHDGLISLHADADSSGIYGYAQGREISAHLLEPALRRASKIFPVNTSPIIDGFHSADGLIEDCFRGILSPPPQLRGWPFEIVFETPGRASLAQQADAGKAAVLAILDQYKAFLAHSWGI